MDTMKKFDKTIWHGIDASKETSLFEYGLLVRYVAKEKSYQCVYRNDTYGRFSYGWISESDLMDIFFTGFGANDVSSFCDTFGQSWDEWAGSSMVHKIHDVLGYYATADIFGCDYSEGYTTKEICQELKIKYYEEYEQAC